MKLVTVVATFEHDSSTDATIAALRAALENSGARLPAHEWVPDKDTIADAYGADMVVRILNP